MSETTQTSEPLYTLENYTPLRNVGRYVVEIASAMKSGLDRDVAPLGMTGAQWIILMRIAAGTASTASELCRTMDYDSGSMTRMLDRLQKADLLRREPSATDRRVCTLVLTDKAKALYPQLPPYAVDNLNKALKGFTAEEEQQLIGYLERIRENLKIGSATP